MPQIIIDKSTSSFRASAQNKFRTDEKLSNKKKLKIHAAIKLFETIKENLQLGDKD